MSKKQQRLVKGKDWHAWCWRYANGKLSSSRDIQMTLESWQQKWEHRGISYHRGGWVRVKLTIVETQK